MTRLILTALVGLAAAADAEPTPQQIAACRSDALRFCAAHIGDSPSMRACMVAHKAQLSQACREAIR